MGYSFAAQEPYSQHVNGWQCLTVANTLAYYDTATSGALKCFIVQATADNVTYTYDINEALSTTRWQYPSQV